MGLTADSLVRLMRDAGFRAGETRKLPEGAFGPAAPVLWSWRPPRKDRAPERGSPRPANTGGAFSGLAELLG
jgi:ATP-dependent RNA helicase SUPV3L1/SUV3